ncbi:hypothetical protein GJ496_003842 [Pomphorhynchus laevis]|nr:hypothetical protein GJ496_003842 [Pomphorhynchus laevis]
MITYTDEHLQLHQLLLLLHVLTGYSHICDRSIKSPTTYSLITNEIYSTVSTSLRTRTTPNVIIIYHDTAFASKQEFTTTLYITTSHSSAFNPQENRQSKKKT